MRKFLKIIAWVFLVLIVLIGSFFIYLYSVARVHPPEITNTSILNQTRKELAPNCYVAGNNWLRKSDSGLWEMYVEGKPFEIGYMNGILAKELIHEQEEAFSDQINSIVPSTFYRGFLRYFIGWFNRDLENHISEEYKLEILGVSKSASHEFDYIGTPYQRLMNYHAAHDIGHALQNLALVGCTSFATWDEKSADNELIVGRNFDFYVGDRFAENKIIQFVNPDKGYKFMMVTWGGMTGVVSGMNMEGLTITLNAARSEVPSGSATPISLLAREILQYAKNIHDATIIAKSRKTFVSESFLIGSVNDNKAVTIEITPDTLVVFDPGSNQILCANHYQSEYLGKTESNQFQMVESASVYRENRLAQLVDSLQQNTPEKTVAILRDKSGLNNTFIGYGNEKSINQLIAHHSIVFEPKQLKVWVSTQPWQLGAFMCYDLNKIFSTHGISCDEEVRDTASTIAADPFLLSKSYIDFTQFRKLKQKVKSGAAIDPNEIVALNPGYYDSYILAGDYLFSKNNFAEAKIFYEKALKLEIATFKERNYVISQIHKCNPG